MKYKIVSIVALSLLIFSCQKEDIRPNSTSNDQEEMMMKKSTPVNNGEANNDNNNDNKNQFGRKGNDININAWNITDPNNDEDEHKGKEK